MNTPTPSQRVDEQERSASSMATYPGRVVKANFARTLAVELECAERDLAAAKEALKAAEAERDAAFKMSKCECGAEEACANLAKAWAERDTLKAENEALLGHAEAMANALDDGQNFGAYQSIIDAYRAASPKEGE